MENSTEVLQKIKIEQLYDSIIPLLGMYPKEKKSVCQRDICIPMSTAILFTTAKTWNQPKYLLMNEWIKICRQQWNIIRS